MDLVLAPLGAEPRPLEEWLTTFHLATVVLDPYTNESSWILPTATRVLEGLRGSDARVNFLVTADERDTRAFLGPLRQGLPRVHRSRTGSPSRRSASASCRRSCSSASTAPSRPPPRGGPSASWRAVADAITAATAWRSPDIPVVGDPGPFHGSPALG